MTEDKITENRILTSTATHCGECGRGFAPLERIANCPDCPRAFCETPDHLGEHRKLGTCPDHADGVIACEGSSGYRDCDGRLWVRHDNGRYFAICTIGGNRHWIDSSLSNLVKEFAPLTPTTDYYGELAEESPHGH